MTLNQNTSGELMINVGMTGNEIEELIRLIDDDEVDEVLLSGIRKKLRNRNKRLRRLVDMGSRGCSSD